MPKVAIAGAGLVGALNACYFAQRGWDVEVYEYRRDIRTMEHVPGRSINLALSYRGKCALEAIGLKDYIVSQGVELHARLVHNKDGKTFSRQPYGQPGERSGNESVQWTARSLQRFSLMHGFFFEHKVKSIDLEKKELIVVDEKEVEIRVKADLVVACDGAHSAVRRSLSTQTKFDYSQEYIEHGYIELNILPKNDEYALEPNVFHLWPRGHFTLIALANRNKTFTVTIFAPFSEFEKKMSTPQDVEVFFRENFPDAFELLGRNHLLNTFRTVPPQLLISVKSLLKLQCRPHHFGDFVLLTGDAAHAMVPFYGQGMNCGFEDCLVLSETLDACNDDIAKALSMYSEKRVKDAHIINDLAMYNYEELKDLVNHPSYKLRKRLDLFLNRFFPKLWIPLYSMVSFTRIPYHKVIENRKWQDGILTKIKYSTVTVTTLAALFCCVHFARQRGMLN
ncbi:putative kynurenine 3-monooxygenase [Dictyocaulus viviparus]|uniref:Kynurenine 3-monooxygenase n=1 Tax=Dictyocaulus viviparus TaxID=29172 RepID=A0A0D8Y616_DICVI|nr:putative kynurenine 3-monooxygenase [Dictyocaulus viviparus]